MQAYEKGLKSGETRLLISPDCDFFKYFSDPHGEPAPPGAAAAAMNDLVVGFGLVLVIEGLLWALVPNLADADAGSRSIGAAKHPAHRRLEFGFDRARPRMDYPRLRAAWPR